MRKADAIAFFGNQSKLAAATGYAESTVSEWPEVLPLQAAMVVEERSRRRVRVDRSLYPRLTRQPAQ
jgi:hypothetical protein